MDRSQSTEVWLLFTQIRPKSIQLLRNKDQVMLKSVKHLFPHQKAGFLGTMWPTVCQLMPGKCLSPRWCSLPPLPPAGFVICFDALLTFASPLSCGHMQIRNITNSEHFLVPLPTPHPSTPLLYPLKLCKPTQLTPINELSSNTVSWVLGTLSVCFPSSSASWDHWYTMPAGSEDPKIQDLSSKSSTTEVCSQILVIWRLDLSMYVKLSFNLLLMSASKFWYCCHEFSNAEIIGKHCIL